MKLKKLLNIFITIFLICSLSGCTTIPVSDEKLDKLGAEVHDNIVKEYGIYSDQKLQSYIEQVGNRIGEASNYKRTPLKFTVLDTPMVNAFSVPGGYIFVTRGLLARANSEAELCYVLGHEIGHLTARHSAQRISQIISSSLFSSFLSTFIGMYTQDRQLANLVGTIFDFGSIVVILNYGREAEFEADKLGIEYSALSNYNPFESIKFLNVLEMLEKSSNRVRYPLFETHPPTEERIKEAKEVASNFIETKKPSLELMIVNDDGYKNYLNGIILGESLETGFIKKNVYYNKNYKFTVSCLNGWKISKSRYYRVMQSYGEDNQFLVFAEIPDKATNLYEYSIDFIKDKLKDENISPKLSQTKFLDLNAYECSLKKSKEMRFLFFQREGIYYTFVYIYTPNILLNTDYIWNELKNSFLFMDEKTYNSIAEDKLTIYKVDKKDTPMSLGKKFYNDVSLGEKLLEFNGIKELTPDKLIKVPPAKYLIEKEEES